ncbi:MAG: gamma-glutamylcyclotransferase family protein [Gemmatimonadota bacterium]
MGGVLYEVAAHQLQRLDEVEGVGSGYDRDESLSAMHDVDVGRAARERAWLEEVGES